MTEAVIPALRSCGEAATPCFARGDTADLDLAPLVGHLGESEQWFLLYFLVL